MPPKKKDGKKGEEEEPQEEKKDLLEKELVINCLRMKLSSCARPPPPATPRSTSAHILSQGRPRNDAAASRYQEQMEGLQVANYRLAEDLEGQKEKLKDINDFLVNELKARALSYAVLQGELADVKKCLEEARAAHEVRRRRCHRR
jgi:hypothetical protein